MTLEQHIAAIAEAHAQEQRARQWLHDELIAAGFHPDLRLCTDVPDLLRTDDGWTVCGSRVWVGNANLSATRALVLVLRPSGATVYSQTYAGHKTSASGTGITIAAALADLLNQPRHGVPAAFRVCS